jgi:hypothetical protein
MILLGNRAPQAGTSGLIAYNLDGKSVCLLGNLFNYRANKASCLNFRQNIFALQRRREAPAGPRTGFFARFLTAPGKGKERFDDSP